MKEKTEESTILRNKDWDLIKDECLRVIEFTPIGKVENGKVIALDPTTPYASIRIERIKYPQKINVFITHKLDFLNLWRIFNERGVEENEEVLAVSPSKYAKKFFKLFSPAMPKLVLMICPKEAFELETNNNYRPELTGEARYLAARPIEWFKPDVFDI